MVVDNSIPAFAPILVLALMILGGLIMLVGGIRLFPELIREEREDNAMIEAASVHAARPPAR